MFDLRSKTKWYCPPGKWFYGPTPLRSGISWASDPPTPLEFPVPSVVGVWIFSGTTHYYYLFCHSLCWCSFLHQPGTNHAILCIFAFFFICFVINFPLCRASGISRKKKQNFAGFSGANLRKNRRISRDFRGKKVKIRGKIGGFREIFAGENSKFAEKSANFAGF